MESRELVRTVREREGWRPVETDGRDESPGVRHTEREERHPETGRGRNRRRGTERKDKRPSNPETGVQTGTTTDPGLNPAPPPSWCLGEGRNLPLGSSIGGRMVPSPPPWQPAEPSFLQGSLSHPQSRCLWESPFPKQRGCLGLNPRCPAPSPGLQVWRWLVPEPQEPEVRSLPFCQVFPFSSRCHPDRCCPVINVPTS